MGTLCALSYVNLFLGAWERNVFANDAYVLYLQFTLCWYRFIDDLFIVWTGSNTVLNEFIQALNHNTDNLYFTFMCNATQISYLDLMIIKSPDGTLGTDLYRKPTAGNTLLHASSAHPNPLCAAFPIRSICACAETGQGFLLTGSCPT